MALPQIGERRSYDGVPCTVRYVGEVAGTSASWLGVEWDDPSRGKHDGQHKGVRYFSCTSQSPNAASFVRPTRTADTPQTFLSALNFKYARDPTEGQTPSRQIKFSGKVAEEVGFEKIRRQQAQLDELQFVILDGVQVAHATDPARDGHQVISQVCPKVRELDLSRNLFEQFGPIVQICSELKLLRSLKVNGNRFRGIFDDEVLESAGDAFAGVTELALEDTLLSWEEICHIASKFPSLTTLHAGSNQISAITAIPDAPFATKLVSLHLELNDFTSLSSLAPLASIPTLRNLLLKGNYISTINPPSSPPPIFGPNLHYLDLSYNSISSWSFIDALPTTIPGLTSLRLTHNPISTDPDIDDTTTTTTTTATTTPQPIFPLTERITPTTPYTTPTPNNNTATTTTTTSNTSARKSEEAYMLTLARLPQLRTLNFSAVTPADRADADMFYLSRIARELAAVPEGGAEGERVVLARHGRWKELCEVYGEPVVVRRGGKGEGGEGWLEGRVVGVEFLFCCRDGDGEGGDGEKGEVVRRVEVPKSFDIYAVKGIVGRLFGLSPLKVRLVWETGEWDPVGGFDEAEGESDEEDMEAEWERREEEADSTGEVAGLERRGGRFVRREVELKDGPRQFGYCVDGLEARIRVERR